MTLYIVERHRTVLAWEKSLRLFSETTLEYMSKTASLLESWASNADIGVVTYWPAGAGEDSEVVNTIVLKILIGIM